MSTPHNRATARLASTPLFREQTDQHSEVDRVRISYERCKAIGLAHNLSPKDVLNLTQKFWATHSDPIMVMDGAAATLFTIQYNLVAGTIAQYVRGRDDLAALLDDLLNYRKIGQFCLTEIAHGLDADNLETTATILPEGGFILHTPRPEASKFMPPTVPAVGLPCVAVVFARLVEAGESFGVRPFIVNLNDGHHMSPGVTARILPDRGGTNVVKHCITAFNNVHLPPGALLGSTRKSKNSHADFIQAIWRVAVGSMALSLIGPSLIELYCAIGATYSARRTIGTQQKQTPILNFRTQQIPILTGIAQAYVLRAFHIWACKIFSDPSINPQVRHGVAACSKTISVQFSQAAAMAISERCGAQGLFNVNQISRLHTETRGIAIAEGDILGLAIRLATELSLGRYELPRSTHPDSLLARHERYLMDELRGILGNLTHHRNEEVNRLVLPKCQTFVEAIGHRMAYDAAVDEGVMPALIELYVSSIIKFDSAWFSESGGVSRSKQAEMEVTAYDQVLPHLDSLVQGTHIMPYVTAPIASDKSWEQYMSELPVEGVENDEAEEFLSNQVLQRARL